MARLALISTMIYSLKDAAERDRLSGTTFIQLNWLLAAWAMLGTRFLIVMPDFTDLPKEVFATAFQLTSGCFLVILRWDSVDGPVR